VRSGIHLNFWFFNLLLLTSCSNPRYLDPNEVSSFSTTVPVAFNPSEKSDTSWWKNIPASDRYFRYEGRVDLANPERPVLIWQATRVGIDFEGDHLALCFDQARGQNYFDVEIDGVSHVMPVRGDGEQRLVFAGPLSSGRHRMVLFKRNEAAAGTVRFRGLEISKGARVWQSPVSPYKFKMEFIGDSITAGACNEDGSTDQWENRLTHNGAMSYAALTAKAFAADHRNISVSGMGVVTGWVEKTAIQIWDRLYPEPSSVKADLANWMPDIVFINLGENDDSFSRAKGLSFPRDFAQEYVRLVRAIRTSYPESRIILLRGGMYGGSQSAELRDAWNVAVLELEANDSRISHFAFTHCSKNHPRVADDRQMAEELVAWVKGQRW
jgi:lysophospholipase L1-like esterase